MSEQKKMTSKWPIWKPAWCPQASRFRGHRLNSFSALRGGPLTGAWWTPNRHWRGSVLQKETLFWIPLGPRTGLWEMFDVGAKTAVQHIYIYIHTHFFGQRMHEESHAGSWTRFRDRPCAACAADAAPGNSQGNTELQQDLGLCRACMEWSTVSKHPENGFLRKFSIVSLFSSHFWTFLPLSSWRLFSIWLLFSPFPALGPFFHSTQARHDPKTRIPMSVNSDRRKQSQEQCELWEEMPSKQYHFNHTFPKDPAVLKILRGVNLLRVVFLVSRTINSRGLTWLKSKASVTSGLCTCSELRSLSTVIASSLKIGFQASFDSACPHFTLFLGFVFHSSPVIVIVKDYFYIWHGSRAGWF